MIRLSANLGFLWPDRPLLERVAAAGRAGFKAIELHWPYDTPARDLVAACDAAGVRLLGVNTAPGDMAKGDFGLGAVPGREADFRAAATQAIDYCAAAGGTAVHAMAGVAPRDAASRAVFVANLKAASEQAARHGLYILIEPINGHDKAGYFLHTMEQAAETVAAVGAPNVRIMFDFYHIGREQGEALARLKAHLPLVGHIQIAAVPSRAEPDEGELDFTDALKAVDAMGYAGWVGAEYRPRGDTDAGLGWAAPYLQP